MADTRQTYKKLPGSHRGVVFSASLWAGTDHLLSVKSARFQEQYKRFYFRDIQAIVITRVPRWVFSTPVLAAAPLLLTGVLIVRVLLPIVADWLWLLLAALAGVWLYISLAQSCICRLYTAVSREDLPSVYRIWTARRALPEIERRIAEAQGVFTENWADAVEMRALGPVDTAGPQTAAGRSRGAASRSRTWVTDIFIGSLFADAVATLYLMRAPISWLQNVSVALTVVQVAAAIGIFVQKYRGILRRGMQKLAIVALLFIGGTTYAQMIADTMTATLAGRGGALAVRARARSGIVQPIYSGGAALLAIAGFVLSFKPE